MIFYLSDTGTLSGHLGFYFGIPAYAIGIIFGIYVIYNILFSIVLIISSSTMVFGILLFTRIFSEKLAKEAINKIESLKPKLIGISKSYDKINYKVCADLIGLKRRSLLNLVAEMIAKKELDATIEMPFFIFHSNQAKPSIPSAEPTTSQPFLQPSSQEPGPPCPECDKATRFIAQYNRYYCDYCQKYIKNSSI